MKTGAFCRSLKEARIRLTHELQLLRLYGRYLGGILPYMQNLEQ
jgi:hypothetical protein